MIAKKVKEMLASVPDDAKIVMSMESNGIVVNSEVLTLSLDSKTKAYCIECNGGEKEDPQDEIDRLQHRISSMEKTYSNMEKTYETLNNVYTEMEKKYYTLLAEKEVANGWDASNLKDTFLSDCTEEKSIYVVSRIGEYETTEEILGATNSLETAKEQATIMAKEYCEKELREDLEKFGHFTEPFWHFKYLVTECIPNEFDEVSLPWSISTRHVIDEVKERIEKEDLSDCTEEKRVYIITCIEDSEYNDGEEILGSVDSFEEAKEAATKLAKEHCEKRIRGFKKEDSYTPDNYIYYVVELTNNEFDGGSWPWSIKTKDVMEEVKERIEKEEN